MPHAKELPDPSGGAPLGNSHTAKGTEYVLGEA